jgi:ubiquinone/menaquinone biosynthesis C-methylase UbiE
MKRKKKSETGVAEGYIHGFTRSEQDRLFEQARIHEDAIFTNVDFRASKSILEIGSGVGAQTQILLERFPQASIQCADASKEQVARAKEALKAAVKSGRVKIDVADALHLPYPENTFDGAFLCWFLEHVQNPVGILKEAKRVLRPGGVIYCNEVFNATFYIHPYSPATLKYWFEFNDYQWSLQGDPFVGGKLANYLISAGYQNVSTRVLTYQLDNRMPKKRAAFVDYWTELLLSGAPNLLKAGRVTPALVREMTEEAEKLKNAPDAVFFYSWIQARAEAY